MKLFGFEDVIPRSSDHGVGFDYGLNRGFGPQRTSGRRW